MGHQAADVLDVALNGATLASEPLARDYANYNAPYTGQCLTFTLASKAQLPLSAASLRRRVQACNVSALGL